MHPILRRDSIACVNHIICAAFVDAFCVCMKPKTVQHSACGQNQDSDLILCVVFSILHSIYAILHS